MPALRVQQLHTGTPTRASSVSWPQRLTAQSTRSGDAKGSAISHHAAASAQLCLRFAHSSLVCGRAGKSTGIVVDSGATATTVMPVFDYVADPAHARRVSVAGDDVTARLCQLMQRSGTHVAGGRDTAIERLKERCCYTAVDVQRETAVRPVSIVLWITGPRACAIRPQFTS